MNHINYFTKEITRVYSISDLTNRGYIDQPINTHNTFESIT